MLPIGIGARDDGDLDVVPCTINNTCPFTCEHCYLQIMGRGYMAPATMDVLFVARPNKIAIVGMEPTADQRSVDIVRTIVGRAREAGIYTSMVTSGVGLHRLFGVSEEEIPDALDISDHWEDDPTYPKAYPRILKAVRRLRAEHPRLLVNTLHALSSSSARPGIVDEMVRRGQEIATADGEILFSPFVSAKVEEGARPPSVHAMPLSEMLCRLGNSQLFQEETRAQLFAGAYNAWSMGMRWESFERIVRESRVRARLDPTPPHENGSIRVTFDGRVIRPDYTIDTALYAKYSRDIGGCSLVEWYEGFKTWPLAHDVMRQHV